MTKETLNYLKIRRGLKALRVLFSGKTVEEAVKAFPSFGFSTCTGSWTPDRDVSVWDTLFDMYCMQMGC